MSVWESWQACSVTCGGGARIRHRKCINGFPELELNCEGDLAEEGLCNVQSCEYYEEWSDWSDCSLQCGGGFRSRHRVCVGGHMGLTGCIGSSSQEEDCNSQVIIVLNF